MYFEKQFDNPDEFSGDDDFEEMELERKQGIEKLVAAMKFTGLTFGFSPEELSDYDNTETSNELEIGLHNSNSGIRSSAENKDLLNHRAVLFYQFEIIMNAIPQNQDAVDEYAAIEAVATISQDPELLPGEKDDLYKLLEKVIGAGALNQAIIKSFSSGLLEQRKQFFDSL